MRKFIISSKYFFILLTVAFVVIPVIYSFRHNDMTTMQVLKKCWYFYLIAVVSFLSAAFLKVIEEDY